MTGQRSPRVALALAGVLVLLAGSTPALAQNLVLRTDRGCGSGAVYQVGDPIRIFYGSSRTVTGRLTLGRPDGTTLTLFNGTLRAGVTYVRTGSIGAPNGTRTLTLSAGTASATCAYSVGAPSATVQEARVLGIVDFHGDQDAVTAPTSVRAGEPFQVTITTFGSGCERQGDEGVIITQTGATIIVYDFTSATRPDVPCTDILKRMPHTVTLSLPTPGEAVIQVWGRRVGPATPPAGVPIVLERRVRVQ